MKLTNKLSTMVVVALALSACTDSVKQQTLLNGDIKELATQSNVESEASTLRIYRGGQVIAQEAIFDDSVGGDVIRVAVPTAVGQGIAHKTATDVAEIKNQAVGTPAIINNVQGAQALADAKSEQTAVSSSTQLGPCGQVSCPKLGTID